MQHGSCRSGDACLFAHGVFEGWLHPARYHTQLCKFGALCQRRVCFFAHSEEELRPASEGSQAQALSQREELLAVLRQDPAMAREIQKYDFEDVPTALPADPQAQRRLSVDAEAKEMASFLESRRIASMYEAYRSQLGVPSAVAPTQHSLAWAGMHPSGTYTASRMMEESSLADQMRASLNLQPASAFHFPQRPAGGGYAYQPAGTPGLGVQGGMSLQDLAASQYTTPTPAYLQQGTQGQSSLGIDNTLQTRRAATLYPGWPSGPAPHFQAALPAPLHAQHNVPRDHPRYPPQGFPAAASGVGVPVDPALLPFQTPYHRAGIEMRGGPALSGSPLDSSLLSELLQQLTRHNEDQGWHSRNDL